MITVACTIIMLHAVVPHHHHDCHEAKGLTFETEVACHCDCDHNHHDCGHHSHHPFNVCLLQEMLSHLVISTSDDELLSAALIKAESNSFILLAIPGLQIQQLMPLLPTRLVWRSSGTTPLFSASASGAIALRAPPIGVCC